MNIAGGRDYWGTGRVLHILLVFLLLLMLLQPIAYVAGGLFVRLAYASVLVACIAAVASHRGLLVIGLLLGGPALVVLFLPGTAPVALSGFFTIATLLFICAVLLSRIFRHPAVTSASISAALAVYIMLGVIWAQAYRLIEHLHPGSFTGLSGASLAEIQRDLYYYSYVTLTTLGYGDMSPVSPVARSLATTEAIVGQLYLVVLVAGLVGLHLTHRQTTGPGTP
jgi:hypothetical protein